MSGVTGTEKERRIRIIVLIIAVAVALFVILLTTTIILNVVSNDAEGNDEGSKNNINNADIKYTLLTKQASDVYAGDLLLVNQSTEYHFPADESALITIYSYLNSHKGTGVTPYQTAYQNRKLREPAISMLHNMLESYYKYSGNSNVLVVSAYRTKQDQADLNSSIKAGFSDSHTGLAVSLKLTNNGQTTELSTDKTAHDWINQNCYKYGFIARYPEGKEDITGVSNYNYYFRYVGYPHAYLMTHPSAIPANQAAAAGQAIIPSLYCFEEYIELLKNYPYSGEHLKFNADDGKTYEIYYVAADMSKPENIVSLNVPSNYEYSVSGNNKDGFIVTVTVTKAAG